MYIGSGTYIKMEQSRFFIKHINACHEGRNKNDDDDYDDNNTINYINNYVSFMVMQVVF